MKPIALAIVIVATALLARPQEGALQRLAQEGDRALSAGRYSEAEHAFLKVRALSPGSAEVLAKLGVIYFQQGKYSDAVGVLSEALKIKPGLPNADALLAMSLAEQGRFAQALPGLEKTFRRVSEAAMKRMLGLQLERAYSGTRRDAKAAEVALELNRLYPDDPEVLYHSGRIFGNIAYQNMLRLSDVAPDSVWRHLAAGEVQESQESYPAAIAEYQQVLALDPRRPGIHFRIGRALSARARPTKDGSGDTSEAMKEFEEELRLDPTNSNAAYEIGEICRKDARFEAAKSHFETALMHYPEFEEAQIALGRTLIAMGKADAAVPHLQKAIALNPGSDAAYYALAQAYLALGKAEDRQQALAKFRALQQKSAQTALKDPRRAVTKQEADAVARQ